MLVHEGAGIGGGRERNAIHGYDGGLERALPGQFLIGCNGGKAVLRAAMDKILQWQIVRRKKIGFRVPIGEWFRGPYRDSFRKCS